MLSEGSKMNVNQMMLRTTYVALYFLYGCFFIYFIISIFIYCLKDTILKQRNVWLTDNKPDHQYAYLLTIKTGTQWNAGTLSKVINCTILLSILRN